jgi:hypothetical protein
MAIAIKKVTGVVASEKDPADEDFHMPLFKRERK